MNIKIRKKVKVHIIKEDNTITTHKYRYVKDSYDINEKTYVPNSDAWTTTNNDEKHIWFYQNIPIPITHDINQGRQLYKRIKNENHDLNEIPADLTATDLYTFLREKKTHQIFTSNDIKDVEETFKKWLVIGGTIIMGSVIIVSVI